MFGPRGLSKKEEIKELKGLLSAYVQKALAISNLQKASLVNEYTKGFRQAILVTLRRAKPTPDDLYNTETGLFTFLEHQKNVLLKEHPEIFHEENLGQQYLESLSQKRSAVIKEVFNRGSGSRNHSGKKSNVEEPGETKPNAALDFTYSLEERKNILEEKVFGADKEHMGKALKSRTDQLIKQKNLIQNRSTFVENDFVELEKRLSSVERRLRYANNILNRKTEILQSHSFNQIFFILKNCLYVNF